MTSSGTVRWHRRYATRFPSPRTERVSPGHLVAIGTTPDGTEVIVWRWYDAVVLGAEAGLIRLWEPSHGEVLAQPRPAYRSAPPGTRAYLSAGLPGADWWVAGGAAASAEDADVELDQIEQFYAAWASSGTRYWASGLPQPVTGSQPGPAV